MDKRQRKMLASILLILLLIAVSVGFTFAKYFSTYNGNGALQVAKWSFKVDGWSTSQTKQISLSDTESEVDLEDGKMAPGFDGRVELELDASDSEVDVQYYIEATENGYKPSNLIFQAIVDGVPTATYSTLQALAENELTGTIRKSDSSQVKNITICCIWPFETGEDDDEIADEDEEDTADGMMENAADYTFSLKVIGTQAKA